MKTANCQVRLNRSPFQSGRFRLAAVTALLAVCTMPERFGSVSCLGSDPASIGSTPSPSSVISANDWPWWRGPQHNGIANADQHPPLRWSETENIAWSAAIPGRGHGAPIVVGDQVVLATADSERDIESLLCFDRNTGEQLWESVIHQGKLPVKMNSKASLASSTVACDGERFFINFLHDGAAWTTAVDRNGQKLWQTRICSYTIHQGYGSSPLIYGDLVIVSADNKGDGGGAVAALNRATGEIIWKQPRPQKPNYPSPVVIQADNREQLILTGCDLITSLNPNTGEKLWEVEGATTECVTTAVTDGTHIFTSGGYPRNHVSAVLADGSGTVIWENPTRIYVPSMICKDGYLFAVLDAGIAMCMDCKTGKELWKGRLAGTFSASPVLVGNLMFATNEEGQTFIFKATAEKFEELGRNNLGDNVFATPTICGGRIYMRAAKTIEGQRKEFLFCIAQ